MAMTEKVKDLFFSNINKYNPINVYSQQLNALQYSFAATCFE